MIESAGFEVQRVVGTIPVPGVRSAPLARVAHVVGNVWPSLFAYTFVVTATLRR